MISPALKERIEKVQRLIKGGATQGERDAAKEALKRILKANGLTEGDLKEKPQVNINVRYDGNTSVIISSEFGSISIDIAKILFGKNRKR